MTWESRFDEVNVLIDDIERRLSPAAEDFGLRIHYHGLIYVTIVRCAELSIHDILETFSGDNEYLLNATQYKLSHMRRGSSYKNGLKAHLEFYGASIMKNFVEMQCASELQRFFQDYDLLILERNSFVHEKNFSSSKSISDFKSGVESCKKVLETFQKALDNSRPP